MTAGGRIGREDPRGQPARREVGDLVGGPPGREGVEGDAPSAGSGRRTSAARAAARAGPPGAGRATRRAATEMYAEPISSTSSCSARPGSLVAQPRERPLDRLDRADRVAGELEHGREVECRQRAVRPSGAAAIACSRWSIASASPARASARPSSSRTAARIVRRRRLGLRAAQVGDRAPRVAERERPRRRLRAASPPSRRRRRAASRAAGRRPPPPALPAPRAAGRPRRAAPTGRGWCRTTTERTIGWTNASPDSPSTITSAAAASRSAATASSSPSPASRPAGASAAPSPSAASARASADAAAGVRASRVSTTVARRAAERVDARRRVRGRGDLSAVTSRTSSERSGLPCVAARHASTNSCAGSLERRRRGAARPRGRSAAAAAGPGSPDPRSSCASAGQPRVGHGPRRDEQQHRRSPRSGARGSCRNRSEGSSAQCASSTTSTSGRVGRRFVVSQ